MQSTDDIFTHTIVGGQCSVVLGRTVPAADLRAKGIYVYPRDSRLNISENLAQYVLFLRPHEAPGTPHHVFGRSRRWLEKYAILIALAGLTSLFCALLITTIQLLKQ